MSSQTDEFPRRAFCELCCSGYEDIALHNKGLQHRGGITHKCDTCKKGFSSVTALKRHYGASRCPSLEHPTPNISCAGCRVNPDHIKSHSSPSAPQGPCGETSCVKPPRKSRYYCESCTLYFPGPKALRRHLGDPAIHPPPPIIPENPEAFCTLCNKQCKSISGLQTHLSSVIHSPLTPHFRCVASPSCRKSFNALSALLYHLESSSCPSELTSQTLAEFVISNDPTNSVTEPDAAASRARFAEQMIFYLGVETDTDSELNGGVTFTPPLMSRSNSMSTEGGARIFDTPSEGSQGTITPRRNSIGSLNSDDFAAFDFQPRGVVHPDSTSEHEFSTGILTPLPSEDGSEENGVLLDLPAAIESNEFACPLCSETRKRFRTIGALQSHMESQTHAPKIYHCPLELLLKQNSKRNLRARKFKALSALAQHIEAGACEGGKEAFTVVVEAVNAKLKEAGLQEMKTAD